MSVNPEAPERFFVTLNDGWKLELTIGSVDVNEEYDNGNIEKVTWVFIRDKIKIEIQWDDFTRSTGWAGFMLGLENPTQAENTSIDLDDCQGYLGLFLHKGILTFERSKYGRGDGDGSISTSFPFHSNMIPVFKRLYSIRSQIQ